MCPGPPGIRGGGSDVPHPAAAHHACASLAHRHPRSAGGYSALTATREIGDLSDREVLLGGALVYWCEGAKDKTYRRQERVSFINSDPAVITFFLRFLRVARVPQDRLRFSVHIHETADLETATRYWGKVTGAPIEAFQKPVIKRHKPLTVRKNLAEDYHGCLLVRVRQSADLYRRIEGWAYAAMLGGEAARIRFRQGSDLALGQIDTG